LGRGVDEGTVLGWYAPTHFSRSDPDSRKRLTPGRKIAILSVLEAGYEQVQR